MEKPDIINAFLGATVGSGVVGPILDKLIEGLKFVYHCREECTALREELEKVKPLLERISGQHQADSAMKNWLNSFEDCVEKAAKILEKCKSDNSIIWDRAYEVKYGCEILELNKQISENLKLAPMVQLALQSASKSTGACGIMQQVPRKILGMDHHFKSVKCAVIEGHRRKASSCLGIRGMGGAGKTLLAQMVNNDEEIREEFGKESIIWITVGRDAEVSAVYERMRKCFRVDSDGGTLEDQRTQLVDEFSKRSVLLILDDIWDGIVHEYKEMVDWLNIAGGAGSVTVITTRDEAITRKCVNAGEEIILQLSEEQSWELFHTHAFGTETVALNRDLEDLARDVCKECKCLPLALKVIGLAMKGTLDICEWKRTLLRLRGSSMVNKGIEQALFDRLRISYDQLDGPTKICFLYFAAFPEDCEIPVEHLCRIWIVEGLFGEELDKDEAWNEALCVLKQLRGRSLIDGSCVERNRKDEWVKMHDILRDLAIHISREGNELECENLFEMEKELEEFPSRWLVSSLKVKRLSLCGDKMKRFPHNFIAPTLRICMLYPRPWIYWEGIKESSQKCIIDEGFFTNMPELKYLQMCGNETKQLPKSIGGLGTLQYLDISFCSILEQLPKSIGGLGSLQYLNISCCTSLKHLPKSIRELGSLQHLNLSWSISLQQLPESIGGLGSLQFFNLQGCSSLQQLPESIGGLGSLQFFNLQGCSSLQQLPESIGGLGSLQHFNLLTCESLQQLPKSIGRLGSLQHLNLSMCDSLQQLPESIGGLGSLQYLDISYCKSLKHLLKSIGGLESLQHLNLSMCNSLQQLPESIGGLESLQHLDISYCFVLEYLPESIGGLESLQHLNLSMCESLQQLPESIGRLGSLQHLNLSMCESLQQLPESIGRLGSLQHFDISHCVALEYLPESIGGLESLQHLDNSYCFVLEYLPESIGGLESLQHLNLSMCESLQQLPESIGRLGSLQHLNLSMCESLQQLPESIGRLGSLQHLNLSMCDSLQQLPESIGGLGSLQHLNLKQCKVLQQLPEFRNASHLQIIV